MLLHTEFTKQAADFRETFEAYVKETLGEEYFSLVSVSNTLGILSISVSLYKGDKERCKNESCYYLNAPHFHWHIQTGETQGYCENKTFKAYSKMSATHLRGSNTLAKYRKISTKTTDKCQAEPKQLFVKLEKWITKNKSELFRAE